MNTMKKIIALLLVASLAVCFFASCKKSGNENETEAETSATVNPMSQVTDLAGLAGKKIAAQSGTFHEQALTQIQNVQSSTYPDFTDLLVAVQSGAIDGYIAEEPTALAACLQDSSLAYIALKNNDTGFTADAADTAIAIGVKEGSELRSRISNVLVDIGADTRAALMEQMVKLSAGETVTELALDTTAKTTANGTLKVAMECGYEPFNWTETGAQTVGAVAISGEGKDGLYANGYDVQIAKYVAAQLGMKLEVYAIEWDSLIPAVEAGTVDAIVAGMSPTAEREEVVDFTEIYYESNLVVIYKK